MFIVNDKDRLIKTDVFKGDSIDRIVRLNCNDIKVLYIIGTVWNDTKGGQWTDWNTTKTVIWWSKILSS